jgi:hypothetical protein
MRLDEISSTGMVTEEGQTISFSAFQMVLMELAHAHYTGNVKQEDLPPYLLQSIVALLPFGTMAPYHLEGRKQRTGLRAVKWSHEATDMPTEELEVEHYRLCKLSPVQRDEVQLAIVANELFMRKFRAAERAYNA